MFLSLRRAGSSLRRECSVAASGSGTGEPGKKTTWLLSSASVSDAPFESGSAVNVTSAPILTPGTTVIAHFGRIGTGEFRRPVGEPNHAASIHRLPSFEVADSVLLYAWLR